MNRTIGLAEIKEVMRNTLCNIYGDPIRGDEIDCLIKTIIEGLEMDYKKVYDNIKTHFEMLCTDEIREDAFAAKDHDLDFQVYRILLGYQELLNKQKNERDRKV